MNLPKKGVRTLLLCGVVAAVFTAYVLRLMQMQIVEGEQYKALVQQGSTSEQVVAAARGEILDRYGNPLAVNATGYNIVLDRAFLPVNEQNKIILKLTNLLAASGEGWIDNLPVTRSQPFQYVEGMDDAIARLKSDIGVQPDTSVENVMYWLCERYKISSGFSPEEQRTIAGIRYEMERRGFNYSVQYTFAENISMGTVSKVKERGYDLPGVDVVESTVREYVSGDLAPHEIGFIGPIYAEEYQELKEKGYAPNDTVGKAGIERAFEDELRGRDGKRKITLNQSGDVIDVIQEEPPVPGNTVILTIDSGLQQVALRSLEREILNLQQTAKAGEGKEADSGAVVVIECKTGDVLAAASYPSYDMDTYRTNYASLLNDPRRPLLNRAIQGTYAAGSIYKPSVAVAGLSEGLITPVSTITCGHVYTFYQGYQPTCLGTHGAINVVDALRYSCNIFFYDLGRQLGIENINRYSTQFGLAQPTGIEIPESVGELSSPETKAKHEPQNPWTGGDVIQSAIGQLYNNFTPLQLANYAATLGNRGKRMDVNIVKSIESYTFDETVFTSQPRVAQQVDAPPEAFETVIQGMVKASRVGTAQRYFANYPIDVASKTGTPQTKDYPNATFIAFAPAEDPQIAVAVVIEKGWSGHSGCPQVAKDIFDEYFFSQNRQSALPDYGVLLP